MASLRTRFTCALSACLFAACGGLGTRSLPNASPAETAADAQDWDAFCVEKATLLVGREMTCLGAPALAPDSTRAAECDLGRASILARRAHLHREALGPCLDALAAMSCADFWTGGGSFCPDVLTGATPLGGACLLDQDCIDPVHLWCGVVGRCRSTCQKRSAAGELCTTSIAGTATACVQGSTCDFQGGGTCTKLVGEGEACAAGAGVCGLGLACDPTGTCVPLTSGTPCARSFWACTPAMKCRHGVSPELPTCVPLKVPGDSCTPGAQECRQYSFCQPGDGGTGACVPSPHVGGSCSVILSDATILESPECIDGWCDRVPGELTGACLPFRQLGEACSDSKECDTGAGRTCTQGRCAAATCGEPL
jgi:hypothetical protein